MRATRGLIATLGAGGSLLAGVACLLAVVSSLISFHGWPGAPGAGLAPATVVAGEPAPSSAAPPADPAAAPVLVVARVAAPATRRRHAATPPSHVRARPVTRRRALVAPPAAPAPAVAARPADDGAHRSGTSGRSPHGGDPVRDVTATAGDTVQDAAAATAAALPAGGEVVTQAASTTGDTLHDAGETVARVVDGSGRGPGPATP